MFGIGQGWTLGNQTRQLVFKDKQLLLYPVISLIAAIVLFGVTLLVALGAGIATALAGGPGGYVIIGFIILFYILVGFISMYVTMAMLIAFRSYQAGNKIGVMAALRQTAPYAGLLFQWTLVNLILVTIIRLIESRLRGIGRLAFGIGASVAITGITFFVLPIILDEKKGPFGALKESADMVAHNIGSSAVGLGASEMYSLGMIILGVLCIVGATATAGMAGAIVSIGLGALGLILIIFGALTASVIGQVYRFVLYEYIRGQGLPDGIDEQAVRNIIPNVTQPSGQASGPRAKRVQKKGGAAAGDDQN